MKASPKLWAESRWRHPATQPLSSFANYSFMMAMRKASGQSEFHETQADILVVQSGEPRWSTEARSWRQNTAPHEIRGTGIQGGAERKLGPGDIVTFRSRPPT